MRFGNIPARAAALIAAALVAACGGGGSPGDTRTDFTPPPIQPVSGPDKFLIYPNPQVKADGTFQTTADEFANAYYRANDPQNERDTLAKWKAKNGFETGTGQEITVVFGDQRDLGYGRRMNARRNPDGTLAFYVENYLVRTGVDYAYSNLNLEAAIVRDAAHFIGVNAIEFSPGPNGGVPYAKWYNFSSTTGQRATQVDLDGRGVKAMPSPCISCHGGRGDALTPPDSTGQPRFNLVQFSESRSRGDVEGHMHPFEPDVFGFVNTPGFTRAEQESAIKTINKWILCTYPLPAASTAAEDQCRRPANPSEWQGTAASLIKAYYGGDGLPNPTFEDTFVPLGWQSAGQATLYENVIRPSCRTCHIMRGSGGNSDIDFTSYEKFQAFNDRVKVHVQERGNMPLAKIVYDAFYRGTGPESVATFLAAQGHVARDAAGVALKPGRPIANPGPSRLVGLGATTLSGSDSLFTSTYAWSLVSGPAGGATLTNTTSARPTFTATAPGSYVVQLVVTGNNLTSSPAQATIVVSDTLALAPSAIRFSDIKNILQTASCTNCHNPTGTLPRPPLYYTEEDRNGDGVINATDDLWFYEEVRSRINFTELAASPLLRKPSGNHHGGLLIGGFNTATPPGNTQRRLFDTFQNWILNGAPFQ